MAAVLVGSTGLVGSHILTTLLNGSSYTSVHAFARKNPVAASAKLQTITSPDSATWPSLFPVTSGAKVFFSALGTTKAQAGSFEAQRAIDLDLNVALAKAAKEAGVETYVLISSSGASSQSMIAYSKMKGELEDAVEAVGFRHCIIVRPGLIVGERDHSRPAEFILRKIAGAAGTVGLKDSWAQDADVIGKAAVAASLKPEKEGVWVLAGADIIRLGRTEWKDAPAAAAESK